MRRFLAFLCAVALVCGCFSAAAAETGPEVFSYQFDLRFHLDVQAFPGTDRVHLQGYADLLDSLEFCGVVTWCPETESMDMNAEIVPVTNPSAAVPFRLYGIPDYMCLSSPLLNGETVFLHNYAFMEFSEKAWVDFNFPLQLIALLDPYETINSFTCLADAWKKEFGSIKKSRDLSISGLKSVSKSWKALLLDDYRLTHWVSGVSSLLEDSSALEMDFASLPSYLTDQVAGGKKLTAKVKDGVLTVTNSSKEILWQQSEAAGSSSLTVSLPETSGGYVPALSYTYTENGSSFSLDLSASYNQTERPEGDEGGSGLSGNPSSIVDVVLSLVSVPLSWPSDSVFTGSLSVKGALLPNFGCTFACESGADGSLLLSVWSAEQKEAPVFVCTGTVVSVPAETVPVYTQAELIQYFNVFSVNDQSLYDFVHRIARPLALGLLDFLYEMPPRACQSVMDDLEDSGILEMILK